MQNSENNLENLLNEAEVLIKEILTEGKGKRSKKVNSLRKQISMPMGMPLSSVFTLDGVMDTDGVSEKMIKYGKFINEYLSEYLEKDYELYDIVEDYDVFEETEVLVDKWVNNEVYMNIMKFNQFQGHEFSEQEYKRISDANEKLANEIYKAYGTFEWIKDAENDMMKKEKEFAKENPAYFKWASTNTDNTSLSVFENRKKGKAASGKNSSKKKDSKKYKIYVKHKISGDIKKINFGEKGNISEKKKINRKPTPRYWSSKFWTDKNINDLLNEIVDPKTIHVEYLKVKDQLNPKIWDDEDKLNQAIRAALLKNAIEFIKFINIENLPIQDIVLTGSLANYTWTNFSDLDIHVVVDFETMNVDDTMLEELFKTKKSLWETKIKSKIKNHDVEVYIEDTNEEVNSTGVYSLIKDSWLEKPIKQMVGIDSSDIQLKSASLMNLIDHLLNLEDSDNKIELFDNLKDKLGKYRQAGLQSEGEFSTENLVFKVLRNSGYLKKIKDEKSNYLNKELSLEYEDKN